jgi:hypothetical protein
VEIEETEIRSQIEQKNVEARRQLIEYDGKSDADERGRD